MKLIQKLGLMAFAFLLSGCGSNSIGMKENEYTDLLVGPYSVLLPTNSLGNVSIIGSENRGLALAFNRKDRDSQRIISISVLDKSHLGYEMDMRKFPRLVLRLEEPTLDLGLSEKAIEGIHNIWKDFVEGRRTKVIKIGGGHAYLAIDEEKQRIIAYLTADNYPRELNFISTHGISEKQLQELVLDNLYLNRLPLEK
ncbi:hypothetical protein D3C78_1314020 [compost metagenome]